MQIKKMLVKRSIAEGLYPNLSAEGDQTKQAPVQGWAPERASWGGAVDHRLRGPTSPIGGVAKGKTK